MLDSPEFLALTRCLKITTRFVLEAYVAGSGPWYANSVRGVHAKVLEGRRSIFNDAQ
jgi:hypothetical protein